MNIILYIHVYIYIVYLINSNQFNNHLLGRWFYLLFTSSWYAC